MMFWDRRKTDMDLRRLAEELGLAEDDVCRLALTFLDSTDKDLLLLEQAYSQQDADQVRRIAHHIKGAADNLELTAIVEVALAMEEQARSGILVDPFARIALIRAQMDSIRAQMKPGG
jgi:HPt (histidine-containing phosphotransfer) domain-containing protein